MARHLGLPSAGTIHAGGPVTRHRDAELAEETFVAAWCRARGSVRLIRGGLAGGGDALRLPRGRRG